MPPRPPSTTTERQGHAEDGEHRQERRRHGPPCPPRVELRHPASILHPSTATLRHVHRRSVLKGGVGLAGVGLLARPARAQAQGAIDPVPPSGWDYPTVVELLPFGHGVASGDPLADRVILWTRITVPDARGWDAADPQGLTAIEVDWVAATDPALQDVVAGGTVVTTREIDWTVKVDAAGLASATTYYYGFSALGFRSPIGRTRTAPALGDAVSEVRFAHSACTSWWSTDFHFYRRIAERNDLDLFLHAGDHVYEFVDDSQWYRARRDIFDESYIDFREWTDADECRRRYALHYADPDLLAAHRSVARAGVSSNARRIATSRGLSEFDVSKAPETAL